MNDWHGCYDDSWQGIIVPEAFSHPAKMSRGLTSRIFKHALSEGWLKPGDVVVDLFGGIGSTGIIGAAMGLRVVCVELEEKFVALGKQNFELNRKAFEVSHMGHSYHPQIIQGDSRKLSEVIAGADCVVGSPPFAEAQTGGGINKKGYHNEAMRKGVFDLVGKRSYTPENQGTTKGNLAAMKPGNIGNDKGETFWAAAKQIVSECHKILKPGGYAIWVVKAFVRKGKIVDFPSDWRRLCEAQGFTTVHEHHAMLVKETSHAGLFEEIEECKEDKSFFRRLHETKSAWKKYWDTVPSATEKAVWKFKASLLCRWWSDPPEMCSPLRLCFEASGKKVRDWNEHVRIDYEVVICTQRKKIVNRKPEIENE
jgi:hypothetical protein